MARKPAPPQLVLSAKRKVWRMDDHAGEGDKEFKIARGAVLDASDYVCVFCGLQSGKYQEVHHADDDHKNNAPSNLFCSCPLCHQVFHIGLAGMKEGGEIVYMPELEQAELNQLALVMWLVTETEVSQFKDPAHALLFTRLAGRAKTIEGALGNRRGTVLLRLKEALKNTSFPQTLLDRIKPAHLSPSMFSNVLMSLSDDDYEKRKDLLGGLRLFPSATRFRERIAHWNAEQGGTLPAHAWYKIVPEDALVSIIGDCSRQIEDMIAKANSSQTAV